MGDALATHVRRVVRLSGEAGNFGDDYTYRCGCVRQEGASGSHDTVSTKKATKKKTRRSMEAFSECGLIAGRGKGKVPRFPPTLRRQELVRCGAVESILMFNWRWLHFCVNTPRVVRAEQSRTQLAIGRKSPPPGFRNAQRPPSAKAPVSHAHMYSKKKIHDESAIPARVQNPAVTGTSKHLKNSRNTTQHGSIYFNFRMYDGQGLDRVGVAVGLIATKEGHTSPSLHPYIQYLTFEALNRPGRKPPHGYRPD
ncbi:hypothetical protein B0H14DRAFT_2570860 [Mycena olivaceomarginata]|nr:hypothetical protein B0H14DRAFT_2570860 [Mycena olivaceomarginata]